MQLPNFLIIGSQKAGTTSLYHVLRKHPEIYMPDTKEVNYFFYENKYSKGIEYYKNYFSNVPQSVQVVGEASPGYICHPLVPERIKRDLPDIEKLIVTVRNPVDRAFSQFTDNLRHLEAELTFDEAFDTAMNEVFEPGKLGYFSRGTYIQYIEKYVQLFGRDRLLVLVFEDLKTDPVSFYGKCFEFLGVDPEFQCPEMDRKFNASNIWSNPVYSWFFKRPRNTRFLTPQLQRLLCRGKQRRYEALMSPEIRNRLVEFYKPWNDRLSEFLGRDLSDWNQ